MYSRPSTGVHAHVYTQFYNNIIRHVDLSGLKVVQNPNAFIYIARALIYVYSFVQTGNGVSST